MGASTVFIRAVGAVGVGLVLTCVGLGQMSGHSPFAKVPDDQVGLLVDHLTGSTRVVQPTGYRFLLPHLQELHLWPKSPQTHRMQGNEFQHPGHVPRLIARGPDGSRFWFEQVVIHYRVDPKRLEPLLRSAGTDLDEIGRLVNAFARPVLRGAFGRYTGEEVSAIENWHAATGAAEEELRHLLARYGLEILQVATSKPRFPEEYEKILERRKAADQDSEALLQEAARLEARQAEELEQLRREKELEKMRLAGELRQGLEAVQNANRRALHEARIAQEDRIGAGMRAKAQRMNQAAWQVERWQGEAEGLSQRTRAMQLAGRPLVRRAIARMLSRAAVSIPLQAGAAAGAEVR